MQQGRDTPAGADALAPHRKRSLMLLILCLVAAANYTDRQVMGILLEPIKREFHASDTAMGFLTGLMFASCYAATAIPLAWLSDRTPRSKVLAGCLVLWSLLTSLGGLAQTFWQLALTRVGVAISESGGIPASHSIIADMYEPNKRARAIGALSSAQSIGIGLGFALGGWLSQAFNWRLTFLFVGIPGLLLAVPLLFNRDTPRGKSDGIDLPIRKIGLIDAFKTLWRLKTYRYLVLIVATGALPGYGMLAWGPTLLMRVHGMKPAQTGYTLGIAVATALVIGNLLGGYLADRGGSKDPRFYFWVAGAGPVLAAPFLVGFALVDSPALIFGCAFLGQFFLTFHIAPSYAMGQTIAPPNIRAMASVGMGLASIVIGAGMGPFLIGGLTDAFTSFAGVTAIRYSLAIACGCSVLAIVPALLGARHVKRDLAESRRLAIGETDADGNLVAQAVMLESV